MSTLTPFPSEIIPLLKDGDQLTRDEFERRYLAMPHVNKAELIEGVVHMPSPVRYCHYSEPHAHLIGWMFCYKLLTPCAKLGDNGTVRLDQKNEPQPDGMLFLKPSSGGHAAISDDDYIEGAPELVAEVAASSASIDLHTKKTAYRRNGVQEYIVWRVLDRQIDWFTAKGGEFEPLVPDESGILRSLVFPGLWLDAPALLRGELTAVNAVLQQGLASPEHAEFFKKHAKP